MHFRGFTKLTLVYSTTFLYHPANLFVVVVVVVAVQCRGYLKTLTIPFSFSFYTRECFSF